MKSIDSIFRDFRKTLNQLDEYITQTDERLDKNVAKQTFSDEEVFELCQKVVQTGG
jgi:Zn-dependent M32 family carboxypeptidase